MKLRKVYGDSAVVRLGDHEIRDVDVIPTGLASLDRATGVGGIPRGRVVEVLGPEAGGKTTLALHLIAGAQGLGGTAAFVDAEHALDVKYARAIGVDADELLVSQPDSGEQALEIAEALIRSGDVDVLVVDSVAALVPRAELEGEMGDAQMGLQARLMSQALRKLTAVVAKSRTILLFINQLRMKLGQLWGNPETTPGGVALKFYASMRIDVRRVGAIKDGDRVVGARTRVRIIKNKVATPFVETELDLMYGLGFSREADLLDLAVAEGAATRQGSWLSFGDVRLGQGREKAVGFLVDNPDVLEKLALKISEKNGRMET